MSATPLKRSELQALLKCAPNTPLSERLRICETDRKLEDSSITSTLFSLRQKIPTDSPAGKLILDHLTFVFKVIDARVDMLGTEREELTQLCRGLSRERDEIMQERARLQQLLDELKVKEQQYAEACVQAESFLRNNNARERPSEVERMVTSVMNDIRETPVAEAPEVTVCDEPDGQVVQTEPTSKNPRPPHSDHQERREERSRSRQRSEARQSRPSERRDSRSRGNSPRK